MIAPSYIKSALKPLALMVQDRLAVIGMSVLGVIILMALFAPLIATHDPRLVNEIEDGSVLVREAGGDGAVVWRLAPSLGPLAIQAADSIDGQTGIAVGRRGTAFVFSD